MVTVIDISYYQEPHKLDYKRVASQIDGVILRGAYGTIVDTALKEHFTNFAKLGVPIGLYHFIVNYRTASEQVKTFETAINLVKGLGNGIELGYWADVENEKGAQPLTKDRVDQYMKLAEKQWGEFGVYTSRNYWDIIMGVDTYRSRKLWVAHYGASVPYLPVTGGWDRWWLWQYTSSGRLDGYPTSLDMSHFWGSGTDFNKWVGSDIIIPSPDPDKPMYDVEIVNCKALTIREGAGAHYNPVGYLSNGDVKSVYEERYGWLRIKEGWISGAYTSRQETGGEVTIPQQELTLEDKVNRLWEIHPELH